MELLFFYMSRICSIVIEHIAQLPVPQDCRWWGWLSECSVWEAEPKSSPFVAIGSPSKMWSRCAIDVSLVESVSKVLPKRTPPIRTQSKTISFDPRLQGEVHLVRDRWSCCSFSYQEDLAVLFVGKWVLSPMYFSPAAYDRGPWPPCRAAVPFQEHHGWAVWIVVGSVSKFHCVERSQPAAAAVFSFIALSSVIFGFRSRITASWPPIRLPNARLVSFHPR
jgi:hypothetical protein